MKTVFAVLALVAVVLTGCKDFPGADGRYATHGQNRGEANTGLPPTPYIPH